MDRDKVDFFFLTLDMHLARGEAPEEALAKTVKDYVYVFYTDDGRLPFNRAAELSLNRLKEEIGEDKE